MLPTPPLLPSLPSSPLLEAARVADLLVPAPRSTPASPPVVDPFVPAALLSQPSASFVHQTQPQWLATIDAMATANTASAAELTRIRSFVTDGVSWEFPHGPPPPRHYENTKAVDHNSAFVAARLEDYAKIGALEPLPPNVSPEYVQPLHVIIKPPPKKPRCVLDLSRNLNDHIPDEPLRYESVESAARLLYPGAWMAKLDISDCFLSWPVHPAMLPFLVFFFAGQFWRFTRMVFGLKIAPAICTMLLSVVSFALSAAGIVHVMYLDDFLIIGPSREVVQRHLDDAVRIFHSFGLILSPSKVEGPAQSLSFLGILINTLSCTLECTRERRDEPRG